MVEKVLDLFPRTVKMAKCVDLINGISSSHIETVVLLAKRQKKKMGTKRSPSAF